MRHLGFGVLQARSGPIVGVIASVLKIQLVRFVLRAQPWREGAEMVVPTARPQ